MNNKISIRPTLDKSITQGNLSMQERFQNEILRPILKMQHTLLISAVKSNFRKKKNTFYDISSEKREDYIRNQIVGDKNIFIELRGMILGQFTVLEFETYTMNHTELSKRIKEMLTQRLISAMHEY